MNSKLQNFDDLKFSDIYPLKQSKIPNLNLLKLTLKRQTKISSLTKFQIRDPFPSRISVLHFNSLEKDCSNPLEKIQGHNLVKSILSFWITMQYGCMFS